jgi:hypothetical protein
VGPPRGAGWGVAGRSPRRSGGSILFWLCLQRNAPESVFSGCFSRGVVLRPRLARLLASHAERSGWDSCQTHTSFLANKNLRVRSFSRFPVRGFVRQSFFRSTIHLTTHSHPYEYTHANPTPRSIFECCVGKSSRLTKSPQAPRCRRANAELFGKHTGLRDQRLRE